MADEIFLSEPWSGQKEFINYLIEEKVFGNNIPKISYIDQDKSAYKAGLREGDTIIEVNKQQIKNFTELQKIISNNNQKSIKIVKQKFRK